MPGGKKSKELRKAGLDRRAMVKKRFEAKFNRAQLRAIREAQKYFEGEEFDPNIVIAGLSDAEKLAMKGKAVPSEMIFKRLIAKRCAALVKDKNEVVHLVPTPLGLVVSDILQGRLTVVPSEKLRGQRDGKIVGIDGKPILRDQSPVKVEGVQTGRIDTSKPR